MRTRSDSPLHARGPSVCQYQRINSSCCFLNSFDSRFQLRIAFSPMYAAKIDGSICAFRSTPSPFLLQHIANTINIYKIYAYIIKLLYCNMCIQWYPALVLAHLSFFYL
jgi:hypothetical protein